MVRELLGAVSGETRGLHKAAYIVAIFALLSQILALLRDRLLAASFGAGATLDVYYSAFRIPDFLFATVASLLSLYALMPVLSRLEEERPGLMLSFMRRALLLFFAAMGVVSVVAYIFAPKLLMLVVPGMAGDPSVFPELLALTRILLLQPILLGASNILASLTQLRHRFLLYSISPLLYNIGIIFGLLVLYPLWGVTGLGWGVVLGAALHFLVQLPFFTAEKCPETLPLNRFWTYLREVLMLSVPRTLTLAAGQFSLLSIIALASLLSGGSIAVFSFAYNLQAVPLTIIGVSYSVAAFPTLSRLFAGGKREDFVAQVESALRHIIFWAIPATFLIIVLRAQLVRVILGAGAFDWTATRLTAAALALFILSLLAQSIMLVITRAYYAAGVTKKPLILAAISVVISVGSATMLTAAFHWNVVIQHFFETLLRVEDTGDATILMLALGYALGPIVQCFLGVLMFSSDFSLRLRKFALLFLESLVAAFLGGGAAYLTLSLLSTRFDLDTLVGIFLQGFVAGCVGLFVTGLVLWIFKNQELGEIVGAFRRIPVPRPVMIEPTDIESSS